MFEIASDQEINKSDVEESKIRIYSEREDMPNEDCVSG